MSFIATVEIDEENFFWLEGLRRAHFPAERNLLSAHLTLFHKLGVSQIERLHSVGMPRAPLPLRFTGMRFLGAGVAVDIDAPELQRFRDQLKSELGGSLTAQDAQRWRPHVTVQNKVTAATAKSLWADLSNEFTPREGTATALRVWRYLGGPWSLAGRFASGGTVGPSQPVK
jgi:2'-5' RNA ligase superfamily protein